MLKSSQEVSTAVTDRDGRVWAAQARLHGDFGGPVRILIFFSFLADQDRETACFHITITSICIEGRVMEGKDVGRVRFRRVTPLFSET